MNEIFAKVQKDLSKLQQTIEKEGEVLLGKLMTAANKASTNKNVVKKRKELEKMVETQLQKLEPAFEKFYTEVKSTAGKYGVDIEKIEKKVRARTGKVKTSSKGDSSKTKKSTTKAAAEKSAVGGSKKAKKKSTKKA
ncbi:MAG: hypothetical protein V4655_12005 [Bdellovibrionota bacterium]